MCLKQSLMLLLKNAVKADKTVWLAKMPALTKLVSITELCRPDVIGATHLCVVATHDHCMATFTLCRARNGDRYSRQCDQNGSTGDQKFSSSCQIGDQFKINNIGCIRLQLKVVNWQLSFLFLVGKSDWNSFLILNPVMSSPVKSWLFSFPSGSLTGCYQKSNTREQLNWSRISAGLRLASQLLFYSV